VNQDPLNNQIDPPTEPPDTQSHEPGDPDTAQDIEGERQADAHKDAVTFSRERFEQELMIDMVLRRGVAVVAFAAVVFAVIFSHSSSMFGMLVVMLCVFAWILISSISANVWRSLSTVTAMIGPSPVTAETHLAELMRRRALMRWVRLLLYHRLASIRHRQHRFAESAAICQAILAQPLGPARRQRGSMLLILAEASMQCHDLHSTYWALVQLQEVKLNLAERLQRLAIQTRYEVLSGHDRAALSGIQQKLLLAELMPAEHCGAMHAMLTASAKRAGKQELADWLFKRSELLCGRERLDKLIRGAFAIGVVGPPEDQV